MGKRRRLERQPPTSDPSLAENLSSEFHGFALIPRITVAFVERRDKMGFVGKRQTGMRAQKISQQARTASRATDYEYRRQTHRLLAGSCRFSPYWLWADNLSAKIGTGSSRTYGSFSGRPRCKGSLGRRVLYADHCFSYAARVYGAAHGYASVGRNGSNLAIPEAG